jgi:hypothetical protein
VEGTAGSWGVPAGASVPNASAWSSSRHAHPHTHTQPDPSLFPARVSQPGSLALTRRSPRLPSVKAKSCCGPLVCRAGGRGTPGAWPLARLRARPGSYGPRARSLVPPPRLAPQVSGCASPQLLLLPRPAGAEKLLTCVASPPPPLPRLLLSLAARWGEGGRWGGGSRRERGGD